MNRRLFLQLLGGAAGATLLAPKSWATPVPDSELVLHHHATWIMGQIAQIWIQGGSESQAHEAINSAFVAMRSLESSLTLFDTASELHALLQHPTHKTFRMSPDFAHALHAAQQATAQTQGNFDPTGQIGSRTKGGPGITLEDDRVIKIRQNLSLDFGGIGCGLALDRAATCLRAHGIERALLELSGDYLALEAPEGWEGWPLTAADPWTGEPTESTFDLRHAALATSSVVSDGTIWDPRTGQRAEHCPQVTVMAPTAALADVWSTAAVVGPLGVRPLAMVTVDWTGQSQRS